MSRKRLDLTEVNGGKFGWLRVVKPAPDFHGRTAWYFNCTRCKRKDLVRVETVCVVHNGQISCGCYMRSCLAAGAEKKRRERAHVTRRYVSLLKLGHSQSEIARRCGVTPQAVSDYFRHHPEKKRENVSLPSAPKRRKSA